MNVLSLAQSADLGQQKGAVGDFPCKQLPGAAAAAADHPGACLCDRPYFARFYCF
jgi:hypothetical protein